VQSHISGRWSLSAYLPHHWSEDVKWCKKSTYRTHGKTAVNPSAGRRLNVRSVHIRFSRVEWRIIPNNIVVLGDYLTYIIDGLIFGTV